MEFSKEEKEHMKFALLLSINILNKTPDRELKKLKVNRVVTINQFDNLLDKLK